jgi:putative phosphoesterase
MSKVGVLSDTHGILPEAYKTFFADCDEIWHAGDIGDIGVLEKLSALKPVKAVYGNIDGQKIRQFTSPYLFFNYGDVKVLLRHIAGRPGSYIPEARNQVEMLKPDILVCGHSHILLVKYDEKNNLLHVNSGAAGNSGFHKMITMLRFDIEGRSISNLEIWEKPRMKSI